MAHLINVANVADGAVPEYRFANPYDVVTAEAGGNTFLIVTGSSDAGLSVFQVEANGALTNRYNLNAGELINAWELASAVVGGTTYLFVTSTYGVNVFSVNANGTLNNEGVTSDFIDGGPTAFAGTWAVATGTAGGKSYVFVSGTNEYAGGGGGITAFEVEADGNIVHRDSVFDNGNVAFNLAYPIGLATGIAGGTTYLFVAGYSDNGVSTFSVDDTDGHLTHVSSVSDNPTLHLGGTRAVTTAVVSGTTYLFVAAQTEGAVTVFAVGAGGALTFASEVVDNVILAINSPQSLTTAVIEGVTYLFVVSSGDDGLSVFSVAADGALTHEDHVVDNGTIYLDAAQGVTAATMAGKTYVYAAGYNDYGVSGFELDVPSPPTATNLTQTKAYTEGDPSVALDDIVVTDADVGETITATLTLSSAAAGVLTTSGGGSYNAGSGIWSITDTVANVNTALAAVSFTPAADNDADITITTHIEDTAFTGPADGTITLDVTPVADAPAASNLTNTKAYTEGAASVDLDNIVVTDPDTGDTITATLTLSNTAAGVLTTSGTSSYTAGTGVWTITGTVAQVNAALAAVAFTPATNNDVDTTITTHIQDAAATGPADGVITLDVTPVNDPPVASNLTQTRAYTEDAVSVALDDIVVSEVDTDPTQSITATLTLANNQAGVLTTSGTASYTVGTGVWTITGTVAEVNSALAAVAFVPTADHDIDTTIATHIQDQNAAGPADEVITLDVTPVNDAPAASDLTQTKAYTEGAASVALDDIVVSEVDTSPAQSITATLTLSNAATGVLTTSGAATYTAGTGVWTITGTTAQVNAALAAVAFTPATNNDLDATITTHIQDQNAVGPANGAITLDVTPVNDPPGAQHGSASGNVNTVINGVVVATDIDSLSLIYSRVTQAAHGLVTVNPDGTFSYTPDADYDGPDSFTFKANDGSADSNDATVNLTVNAAVARADPLDFDGDGKGDILFQNTNGTPAVWLLDGVNVAAMGGPLPNPGPSWHAKASGDFNGDGKADILWQNDNGTAGVWLMDGTNVLQIGGGLANPGPSWKAKEAADFDGDGKADILWQNDNGTAGVWLMDGVNVKQIGGGLANPGPSWKTKAAADFNGDGKADILWQHDDGRAGVWLMDGTNVLSTGGALNPGSAAWHAEAAGDFNGDGKADILWQHDDGTAGVWLMDGTNVLAMGGALANPGPSWHVKEAIDANGDGKADILWQNDNGTPGVWLMDGTNVMQIGGALHNPGTAWHIV